nr:WAS/WASL-interacting protein family member 2-like [Aegilops tauschii subsp. strangulata]
MMPLDLRRTSEPPAQPHLDRRPRRAAATPAPSRSEREPPTAHRGCHCLHTPEYRCEPSARHYLPRPAAARPTPRHHSPTAEQEYRQAPSNRHGIRSPREPAAAPSRSGQPPAALKATPAREFPGSNHSLPPPPSPLRACSVPPPPPSRRRLHASRACRRLETPPFAPPCAGRCFSCWGTHRARFPTLPASPARLARLLASLVRFRLCLQLHQPDRTSDGVNRPVHRRLCRPAAGALWRGLAAGASGVAPPARPDLPHCSAPLPPLVYIAAPPPVPSGQSIAAPPPAPSGAPPPYWTLPVDPVRRTSRRPVAAGHRQPSSDPVRWTAPLDSWTASGLQRSSRRGTSYDSRPHDVLADSVRGLGIALLAGIFAGLFTGHPVAGGHQLIAGLRQTTPQVISFLLTLRS